MDWLNGDQPRGCWIEVDLDRLLHNLRVIRDESPEDSTVLAVVKADAYGHGAEVVAETLAEGGVEFFGVATLDEATKLRRIGIDQRILVMGHMVPEATDRLLRQNLDLMLYDPAILPQLQQSADQLNTKANIHLKVDTGMGRLGILPEQVPDLLDRLREFDRVRLAGIATHFPVAGENPDYTSRQIETFESLQKKHPDLESEALHWHCSNTAAVFSDLPTSGSMIRPGLSLYGYAPEAIRRPTELRPVLQVRTVLADEKTVPPDFGVSYGRTFQPEENLPIGVLPVGYADGYPRVLSNRAHVLVKGEKRPVRGNICMDMTVIELEADDSPDSVVTLMGESGDRSLWADELAEWAGTIPYEILTGFRARIPRIYFRNGDPVKKKTLGRIEAIG